MNPLLQRVIKNSGYLFGTTSISAALGMVQGILVARMLGVEGFGILGAVIMFTSVVNNFASFRMSELVIKYVGHYSEMGDQERCAAVFKLAAMTEIVASLVAFALLYLLAPLGARYLAKDPTLTYVFILYGLVVLTNLIAESSTGLLQIYDRFRRLAWLGLIANVVTLAIIAVLYVTGGNLASVLLAYMIGKSMGVLGLTLAALLEARQRWGSGWWRVPLGILRPQFGELTRFAISTNISGTISLVTKDSELLWVSLLRNPLETGYYRLALTLTNLVQMPVNPLPQATYPELSRQVASKRWGDMRYILRRGALLAGGYTLLATLFLVILGRPLIAYLYTADYLPAYPALVILLLGYLAANTFYWRRSALLALGRADYPAKVNAVLAVLKLVGIALLIPTYGYLASAALLSAFYWVGTILTVWKTYSLMSHEESQGGSLTATSDEEGAETQMRQA
jgi:O-antigen/teichoic acid export membrane protein